LTLCNLLRKTSCGVRLHHPAREATSSVGQCAGGLGAGRAVGCELGGRMEGSHTDTTFDEVIDRILERCAPDATVERSVLDSLVRQRPPVGTVASLLASENVARTRAAVLYLGLYGTQRDCPALVLCLHHADQSVTQLAEHCLWSIWTQSGSAPGTRQLAAAIAAMNAGHFAEAEQALSSLVEIEPEFAEAYFQRGLALATLERTEDAILAYEVTLRLNPYHFGAAAALGHAHVEKQNLATALHYYRYALRIHPRLEDLPAAVAEIESILASRGRC
jgi:tetratricopeptide (TPR) repeat protein